MRLKGYDYSESGEYFITFCTLNREEIFGKIKNRRMVENSFGSIVRACWTDLPNHYSHIMLDAFIVMPDHVHGIIVLTEDPAVAGLRPATARRRHSLSEIVRALKSFSARRINEARNTPGQHVWQISFHDHIIRDQKSFERIRQYIRTNPQRWKEGEHDSPFSRVDEIGLLG